MAKDYYKILGLDKSATEEQIRAAFRKLAHQCHPDKPGGDECKFKEINEAYQVLIHPEKRKQYDQFGATFDQQGGFGGGMNWEDFMRAARGGGGGGMGDFNFDFGGLDLGDIFGNIFGGGGRTTRKKRQSRGSDIQVDLTLDFKEAVFGVKKTVELYKEAVCDRCKGSMAEPGTKVKTCDTCKGQGQVAQMQRTFLGAIQTVITCPDCRGEGKIAEKKCGQCQGYGVVKKNERLEIDIPAGVENGTTLRLSAKGAAGMYGAGAGDLFVRLGVRPSQKFEREGFDIYQTLPLSFKQAALGDKVDVETLDGKIELKIPAGTQPGTKFRLRDKGVPHLQRSGRGDMYVMMEVVVPKKLSRQQKELLEQFEE